jgi:hypothetical protein
MDDCGYLSSVEKQNSSLSTAYHASNKPSATTLLYSNRIPVRPLRDDDDSGLLYDFRQSERVTTSPRPHYHTELQLNAAKDTSREMHIASSSIISIIMYVHTPFSRGILLTLHALRCVSAFSHCMLMGT